MFYFILNGIQKKQQQPEENENKGFFGKAKDKLNKFMGNNK